MEKDLKTPCADRAEAQKQFELHAQELIKHINDKFECGGMLLRHELSPTRMEHSILLCGDTRRLSEMLVAAIERIIPDNPEVITYTMMTMCKYLDDEIAAQIKAVFQRAVLNATLH